MIRALASVVGGGLWWFFLHVFTYDENRIHGDDVEKPFTIHHPPLLKPHTLRERRTHGTAQLRHDHLESFVTNRQLNYFFMCRQQLTQLKTNSYRLIYRHSLNT
jgi:hypothetical protein